MSDEQEPVVSLAELLAMGRVQDAHALGLRLYAGDAGERPLSEWDDLYAEFMSKPTDVPREQWHAEFQKNKVR